MLGDQKKQPFTNTLHFIYLTNIFNQCNLQLREQDQTIAGAIGGLVASLKGPTVTSACWPTEFEPLTF